MSDNHLESANGLYFPPDVEWMRTPLRDRALAFIHKTALDLAGERVKSACITVGYVFGEPDSETIDLTMTVDSDWEYIKGLQKDIIHRVSEWTSGWSKDDWEDYATRVFFCLLPVKL